MEPRTELAPPRGDSSIANAMSKMMLKCRTPENAQAAILGSDPGAACDDALSIFVRRVSQPKMGERAFIRVKFTA
jgi:hypothetical protein